MLVVLMMELVVGRGVVHDPAAETAPEEPGGNPGPGGSAQGDAEDLH